MGRAKHTESAFNTAHCVSILAQAAVDGRTDKWKKTMIAELMMAYSSGKVWDGAHVVGIVPL